MVVVADTSPLNYLVWIEAVELLRRGSRKTGRVDRNLTPSAKAARSTFLLDIRQERILVFDLGDDTDMRIRKRLDRLPI